MTSAQGATVRFFAAAQEAVGHDSLTTDAQTVGALKQRLLAEHPALTGILPRCAVLVVSPPREKRWGWWPTGWATTTVPLVSSGPCAA